MLTYLFSAIAMDILSKATTLDQSREISMKTNLNADFSDIPEVSTSVESAGLEENEVFVTNQLVDVLLSYDSALRRFSVEEIEDWVCRWNIPYGYYLVNGVVHLFDGFQLFEQRRLKPDKLGTFVIVPCTHPKVFLSIHEYYGKVKPIKRTSYKPKKEKPTFPSFKGDLPAATSIAAAYGVHKETESFEKNSVFQRSFLDTAIVSSSSENIRVEPEPEIQKCVSTTVSEELVPDVVEEKLLSNSFEVDFGVQPVVEGKESSGVDGSTSVPVSSYNDNQNIDSGSFEHQSFQDEGYVKSFERYQCDNVRGNNHFRCYRFKSDKDVFYVVLLSHKVRKSFKDGFSSDAFYEMLMFEDGYTPRVYVSTIDNFLRRFRSARMGKEIFAYLGFSDFMET